MVKNYDNILSHFHPISKRYGQNCYINIARQCAHARQLERLGYPTVKNVEDMFIRFDRIHDRDRRTKTA